MPSHFGISADLTYMGKPQEAEAELAKMVDQARNDGELRTAFFGLAVVAADSGKLDKALQQMDKEFAVAEKKNDGAAMAADLQAKGNILAEMQKYDQANQQFDRSLKYIEDSSLSQEIKDNASAAASFQSDRDGDWQERLRGSKNSCRRIPPGRRGLKEPGPGKAGA